MGNNPSNLVANPDTGLSPHDIKLIRHSWARIAHPDKMKESGEELFIALFKHFPYTQLYFEHFKDMTPEQMKGNPTFDAHVLSAMNMLTLYVQNLENATILVALVERVAASHFKRGIPLLDFQNLASIFVTYLKERLGERNVSQDTAEAWNRLLTVHSAVVEGKIKSLEESN